MDSIWTASSLVCQFQLFVAIGSIDSWHSTAWLSLASSRILEWICSSGMYLILFIQVVVFQLVSYMTTTFSPTDMTIRKELTVFKITTGVVVFFLMLMTVLAGIFAYLLFERPRREEMQKRSMLMGVGDDNNYASGQFPSSRMSNVWWMDSFKLKSEIYAFD